MKLVIVTGMSGSGKTQALKMLEDLGYFCVDNLPIQLMESFAQLLHHESMKVNQDIALGIDVRSGEEIGRLNQILLGWSELRLEYQILFLDAEDRVLVRRYKETRRSHPLSAGGRIDEGIARERQEIQFLKEKADYIIDTSQLLTRELRQELEKIFVDNHEYRNLYLTILSFGFKYGIPGDADLVFDVRFLPNPYYDEELRSHTGEEAVIQEFVMQGQTAAQFLEKFYDMLEFLIPNYINEGKNQLVLAIGCTGGKHRSVTIAQKLYEHYRSKNDLGVKIEHRDIDKDNKRKNGG